MSPADILAAARANAVGPYLPAKVEWLDGWCGPLTADVEHYGVGLSCIQAPGRHGPMMGLFEVHFRFGGIVMDAEVPLSTIRLDTRIPAVRDHLVRLGCPEWARDVPAAVWCWGMGVEVRDALEPSKHPGRHGYRYGREYLIEVGDDLYVSRHNYRKGWRLGLPVHARPFGVRDLAEGPETGDEGRACADVAALNAGCILRVEGGWLVPLPLEGM